MMAAAWHLKASGNKHLRTVMLGLTTGCGEAVGVMDCQRAEAMLNDPLCAVARHDALGQRSMMFDPDGGKFSHLYDERGQIRRLMNPDFDVTSWTYDALGRPRNQYRPNITTTSWVFDDADRTTRTATIRLIGAGVTLCSFDYRYDNASNPLTTIEGNGDRVTYAYDASNQLLAERRSGSLAYATTYVYDPVGNRTLKQDSGARTTSSYDAANQLITAQAASDGWHW